MKWMGAERSVAEWSNWSGKQTASPQALVRPASEEAVAARVRSAAQAGSRVRCLGAGHSHSPLAATEGVLLDLEALAGVESVDREQGVATIRSGTRIYQLGSALRGHGLGLHNQGDIDRQALAGATATGTHGTGRTLACLSASVVGARVALADGSLVDCDAEREPGLLALARLGLGAVGAITRLDLSVRDAYRLRERMWLEPLDAVLDRSDELAAAHRHFQFFWYPGRAKAICKACDETDDPPEYPLADEGRRVGWSYEVLANQRPERHTEMEYSLPAGEGPACFREIRALVEDRFPEVTWPLEYRSVAADNVWLSMAHGRPTVTISVHQDAALDDEPVFRACEEVFARHTGRPHWGKVHYRSGKELAALYPRWDDWWRERDRYDPGGVFLNDYVASLRT
jgi:FAD/FMN-containing dehydrogenase